MRDCSDLLYTVCPGQVVSEGGSESEMGWDAERGARERGGWVRGGLVAGRELFGPATGGGIGAAAARTAG